MPLYSLQTKCFKKGQEEPVQESTHPSKEFPNDTLAILRFIHGQEGQGSLMLDYHEVTFIITEGKRLVYEACLGIANESLFDDEGHYV